MRGRSAANIPSCTRCVRSITLEELEAALAKQTGLGVHAGYTEFTKLVLAKFGPAVANGVLPSSGFDSAAESASEALRRAGGESA